MLRTIEEEFFICQRIQPELYHLSNEKNRYSNIKASLDNRVILGNNEYINADRYNNFILAQSPKLPFLYDFWLMVFENEIETIFCLTQEFESNIRKMDIYWPNYHEKLLKFKDINVVFVDQKRHKKFIERHLVVIRNEKMHYVRHVHFLGWPDHGIPLMTNIYVLENVYQESMVSKPTESRTNILVQCSAGVGRTGTLVCILECLQSNRTPFEVLHELRHHRSGAVQTFQQYKFIHEYLKMRQDALTITT